MTVYSGGPAIRKTSIGTSRCSVNDLFLRCTAMLQKTVAGLAQQTALPLDPHRHSPSFDESLNLGRFSILATNPFGTGPYLGNDGRACLGWICVTARLPFQAISYLEWQFSMPL